MAAAVVRCAVPSDVLPGVRWYFLDGAADEGDDSAKWTPLGDVSRRLRVSVRALQQWAAPGRELHKYDVSDSLRLVRYAELPDELKTRRGRSMIRSTALELYLRTVYGRRGAKRRSAHSEYDIARLLPLPAPRVSVTSAGVAFNDGEPMPRARFVAEWIEPLAAELGYALVPLATIAALHLSRPSPPPTCARSQANARAFLQ